MKKFTLITRSAKETIALGKKLSKVIGPGMVIGIIGELGSGKTTLTKGIVKGLTKGKKITVKSPSFALVNEYRGAYPIYHIDCYRLDALTDFQDIGIDEFLFSKGIAIIEWAERISALLPKECISVTLSHVDEQRRKITIVANNGVLDI